VNDLHALSFWHDTLDPDDAARSRPPLPGDVDVDVAIVGAGFTGLWTAYYLLRRDPQLRVVVLERETAGFGASGRNGGWCIGNQVAPLPVLEKATNRDAAIAMARALQDTVDEVGAVVEREHIDCGFAKGGAILLATTPQQLKRLDRERKVHARYGLDDHYTLLSPRETTKVVNAAGVYGSVFTPHAAAVHPARLARGIAVAVETLGGTVHEHTAALAIEAGRVRTRHGTVRAPVVVRATEAYTSSLEGHERTLLPLGNFMIATEPIDDDVWAEIGLANREVFEDCVRNVAYGQRTADNRIAWGGLSTPTWWRSQVPPSPMTDRAVAERLRTRLVARFPMLDGIAVTHHWGGVLGVPRDLRPGVGLDPTTGLAWAGGYIGAGVAASNTAGRTLADLITGTDSDLTRLPWTGHESRPWEPEPLRWLGVRTVASLAGAADRFEQARS
jgi:glycine/D-amino acid oxidase-like deaminating enzyme